MAKRGSALPASLIRKHHGNLRAAWAEKRGRRKSGRRRNPLTVARANPKRRRKVGKRRNPITSLVRSNPKRRRKSARRRNPVATIARSNPRRHRKSARRRNPRMIRTRRSYNPRKPNRRVKLYQVRGGYRGRKIARSGRSYKGGQFTGMARMNNPFSLKGMLNSLTNVHTLKQYGAGALGIGVAKAGGGLLAAKLREWTGTDAPDSAIARDSWGGVVFDSAVQILTTGGVAMVLPAKYRGSFLIGGGASAIWNLLRKALKEYAPEFSAQIGLDGWLTDGELEQLGLSGGMGDWLSRGQTQRLALQAPQSNPQYIRLPGAQKQFSGA